MDINQSHDSSMIIGFDLDGVILDHTDIKIKLADEHGFTLHPEQTPSDRIKSFIPLDIFHQMQQKMYDHPILSCQSPLMDHAWDVLQKLRDQRVPLFLISRRHDPIKAIDVLRHHRLWPTFFDEKNTAFVAQPSNKDIKAQEFGITHYIDDELHVLNLLTSVPQRFLFDPLQFQKDSTAYRRVASWTEFENYIKL